jgi:hypothetical protein
MMTWRAELRPSAKEMLQHEWIREGGVAGDNVIQQEVLHRMKVRLTRLYWCLVRLREGSAPEIHTCTHVDKNKGRMCVVGVGWKKERWKVPPLRRMTIGCGPCWRTQTC